MCAYPEHEAYLYNGIRRRDLKRICISYICLLLATIFMTPDIGFSASKTDSGLAMDSLLINKDLRKGIDLYNRNRYPEAAAIFRKFLEETPFLPNAGLVKYALGSSYLEMKMYDKAEEMLGQASREVTGKPEILLALSKARLMQNKYDSAAAGLENYLKARPTDSAAQAALCNVYLQLDEYEKAEVCLDRATVLSPNMPDLWANYGALLTRNGKNDAANKAFARAKKLDPKYGNVDLYIGMTAYQNRDYTTAQAVFERLYAQGKANANILGALGSISAIRKDYKKAEIYFQKALKLNPKNKTFLNNLILCKENLGKRDEAVQILKDARKRFKDDPEVLMMLVSLYVQSQKYGDATALLESMIKKYPKNAEYIRILAALSEQGFDSDKPARLWRSYLKLKPGDIKSRESLARVLKKANKKEEALKEYEQIIRVDSRNEEAYKQTGLLCEDLEKTEKAAVIYRKMAVMFPDSAFPPGRLGLLAEKENDVSSAESLFETAIRKPVMEELYVYTHLAAIKENKGNQPEAEQLYRQGLEKMLDHSQQVFMDFVSAMQQNKGALDLVKLMEISEKEKGSEKELDAALNGVHQILTERGDEDEELDYFLRLSGQYKANKKPALFAARLLNEKGDYDRLIGLCEAILKIDVRDSEAHFMMGTGYKSKGDIVEAGKAFKRAVEADSSNTDAWKMLIDNYKVQGRIGELLTYAEKKLDAKQNSEVLKDVVNEIRVVSEGSNNSADP